MDEKQLEKLVQTQIEVTAKTFEKASAYTNLIIVVGYAGAFTIWANTKVQLSPYTNIVVATSLGASILLFVSWEIYKMISNALIFVGRRKLLHAITPDQVHKTFEEIRSREMSLALQQAPIWAATLAVTVLPAVIAVGTLSYNYFSLLFGSELTCK